VRLTTKLTCGARASAGERGAGEVGQALGRDCCGAGWASPCGEEGEREGGREGDGLRLRAE